MASTSGSLTTTGSVTLTKPDTDTSVLAQISGTYGTVTFMFEGSIDGTNYFPVAASSLETRGMVNGTISPSNNAELAYEIPAQGLSNVRARVTAIASGTATFSLQSSAYVGTLISPAGNPGAGTVTAASLATGATTTFLSIPVVLANVADGDVLTTFTPGFAGKIVGFDFAVTDKVTTAAKTSTLNLEIGTTNLTGGALALTSANCGTLGAVVSASAITGGNTFTSSDTISIEASSTTAFAEGQGVAIVKIQNYTA